MTSIEHFANRHQLRVKRDEVGGKIIPGRLGHLYEYDGAVIGLILISPNGDDLGLDNTLRARMRKALREGLELHLRGDYESIFLFSPENRQHARLAIRLIGCKRKRRAKLSPNFLAARKHSQFQRRTVQEGPERPQSEPISALVGVGGRGCRCQRGIVAPPASKLGLRVVG